MRKKSLEAITKLAFQNEKIVFIGSDLGIGTMTEFKENFPDRFFIEGIGEQQIVSMAAGLALGGFKPYICTIANFFTRRAFEQIALDICLNNLPVTLVGFGGGMVYSPLGPTHTAFEDLALMRCLPNMTVACPADSLEMERVINYSEKFNSPLYVRVGKGGEQIVTQNFPPINSESCVEVLSGGDISVITTGVTLQVALETAKELSRDNIIFNLFHFPFTNSSYAKELEKIFLMSTTIITLEEHSVFGGLSYQFEQKIAQDPKQSPKLIKIGLPHDYPHNYGAQREHFEQNGLTVTNLKQIIKREKGKK